MSPAEAHEEPSAVGLVGMLTVPPVFLMLFQTYDFFFFFYENTVVQYY